MKTGKVLGVLLLVATPLASLAAEPKLNCVNDITYSPQFLQNYPNAPAACREVIIKDGQKWARFEAEVVKVKGQDVTAHVLDAYENSIATVTFKASSDARLTVDGSPTKYSSLQSGQKLTFWVPNAAAGFYAAPVATPATKLAVVERHDKLPKPQ
jgi:hypothetical protein